MERHLPQGAAAERSRLPFRAVNRPGRPGYDAGMQRHHLLPCQLLGQRCFAALLAAVGSERVGFDDFRRNGLLLPATVRSALRMRLPLHRGPHGSYNAMVVERVGRIEHEWSLQRLRAPDVAAAEALHRLTLLQRALRRRLLAANRPPVRLNRLQPVGTGVDFTDLDAMADALWAGTAIP